MSSYIPCGYQEFPAYWPARYPVEADWSYFAPGPGMHRVLPDGRIDLLTCFRLAEDGNISDLQIVIAGPSTRFFMVPVQAGSAFIGVRFRAGWGGSCIGVNPLEICNQNLTGQQAEILLGPHMPLLRQARDIRTLHCSLRKTVDMLVGERKMNANRQALEAIELLHIAGGRMPVAELAMRVNVSERNLRRTMRQLVGFPVKTLASILRFQRTARLLRTEPGLSLTAAAAEGGYCDQAHMCRDFRHFGGFSPSDRATLTHGDLPL